MSILKLLKLTLLACMVIAMATSCNKDEEPGQDDLNTTTTSIRSLLNEDKPESSNKSASADEDDDCFSLVFPLDITLPNGTTLTTTSEENLEDAVDAFYEANPDTEEDPTPVFPITVILKDGSQTDINNDEEFEDLLVMCDDYDYYDEEEIIICFEIDYPITLIFADDQRLEVNNDEELKEAILEWEATNDNEEEPTVDYPINITLDNGMNVVITNDDELEEVFDSCYEDYDCDDDHDDEGDDDDDDDNDDDDDEDYDDENEDCFDLDFPLTVAFGDERQTVENYDELDETIDAWEIAYPDSNNEPELVFPISITFEDGTQKDIASEEGLDAVYDDCDDD